jgi:metal-dependent hydrolase (beta-lactamase superfamily II)
MFGPKGGLLAKSLSDAGIKREDIDAVVISHGHIDHVGGIVDESGALTNDRWTRQNIWRSMKP